ncbi:MAG: virginiamycin B lyase family protein [Thermomicrobiales bacterium]
MLRGSSRALRVMVAMLVLFISAPAPVHASSPTITGISPATGTVEGGTTITITGTGFAADALVTLGGFATLLMSRSPTQIVARTLPHTTGTADVTVKNGDGGTATLTGGFLYTRPFVTLNGAVQEFTIPTANSLPHNITLGPDGNLWFTEQNADRIGRITLVGAITEFPISVGRIPTDIAAGPDGALWFTELAGNNIGRMTTAGLLTNEYPIPLVNSVSKSPDGIALGPDGNIWFTEFDGNNIGRITPAGAITEFPIPTAHSQPIGITTGSDGNLWFTESSGSGPSTGGIASITPTGLITEYHVESNEYAITPGAGGSVHFTETGGGYGFISLPPPPQLPTISLFSGNANSVPRGIAAGPDTGGSAYAGSATGVWFLESGLGKIYRVLAATDYTLRGPGTSPTGLATGVDSNFWFTEPGTNKIGVLFIAAPTMNAVSPPHLPADAAASVTITGLGFAPGATVSVGGTAATSVTVVNSTTITITAPALPSGVANIVVTNPGPASSPPHNFYYGTLNPLPPVQPSVVPVGGSPPVPLPPGRPTVPPVLPTPHPLPPPRP